MKVKELITQLLDEDLDSDVVVQYRSGTPCGALVDGINMNNYKSVFLNAGSLDRPDVNKIQPKIKIELIQTIKDLMEFVPDRFTKCHGDKCRQIQCLSCNPDSAEKLDKTKINLLLEDAERLV